MRSAIEKAAAAAAAEVPDFDEDRSFSAVITTSMLPDLQMRREAKRSIGDVFV